MAKSKETIPISPESSEEVLTPKKSEEQEKEEAFLKWLFEDGEKPEWLDNENEEFVEAEIVDEDEEGKDPFERHYKAGVEKLKEKYLGAKMPEKEAEDLDGVLEKEEETAKIEYVKQWMEDNKEDLEKQHPQMKTMSEEKKIGFALTELENNPLKDLEENKETQGKYPEFVDKITNLYALRAELKKGGPPSDASYLAFRFFYERGREALKKSQESSDPEEIKTAEAELLKYSKIAEELAGEMSGRNIEKEAEKQADYEKMPPAKEQYIKDRTEEKIKEHQANQKSKTEGILYKNLSREDWKRYQANGFETKHNIGGPLSQEQVRFIVENYGIEELDKIKNTSLLNPKNWLKVFQLKADEIQIGKDTVASDDFDKFLLNKKTESDNKMKERFKIEAEKNWNDARKEYMPEIRANITKEIFMAETSEDAIKEKYNNLKSELYEEWEKEMEAKKASREKIPVIKKRESETPESETMAKILELGLKEPKEIKKYLKKHSDDLCDILENIGISVDKETLKKFVKKLKNRKILSKFMKRFMSLAIGA